MKFIRGTLGPLFLILGCPPFAILMWYTNTALQGSLHLLWQIILNEGFFHTVYTIWRPVFFGSSTAWILIFPLLFLSFY